MNCDLAQFGGRRVLPPQALFGSVDPQAEIWDFGLIPTGSDPEAKSVRGSYALPPQVEDTARAIGQAIPDLKISGAWQLESRRYALWQAPKQVLGKFLPYIYQVTGSCVGAGGANCARTTMCVEIAAGEMEEYKELWWPFTYGRSRFHAGMKTPGEGSFGEAYAKAALEDGYVAVEGGNFPAFRDVSGWLQLDQGTERSWSDGDAQQSMSLLPKARERLFKSVARCRSADDVIAALANGYCCTQASMFGTRTMVPSPKGNPAVRIASWDGSWAHQMFVDEFWDHPTEGELFRVPNNWGPTAHGSPTGDEPPGGFYLRKPDMNRICTSGEVFAFSAFVGFPSRRKLPWVF